VPEEKPAPVCVPVPEKVKPMKFLDPESPGDRGSVLLLTVVLLSLLSVLFLFATNFALLGTRARDSLRGSVEMLYIAEAGLAHGRAFCSASGESSPILSGLTEEAEPESEGPGFDDPFGERLPFGRGDYRVRAFRLSTDEQPFIEKDSGILLVSTARLEGQGGKRVCLLLEEPPSCRPLAWWEPD
jgi:hypothetical protein